MKPEFDNPDLFSFDDSFASLYHLGTIKKKVINVARKDFEEYRVFAREHLRPLALAADLRAQKDKNSLADDMLALAVKHKMLTRMIPQFLGGTGSGVMWGLNPGIEELASVDPCYNGGVIAGHGLGFVALSMTMNMERMEWVAEQTVKGEQEGKPFLIDCAITEPMAGTDYEEVDLLPRARLMSSAKRVNGGAVLNGSKCFISSGHLANYHLLIMPYDINDPVNSNGMFLVANDAPGFNLGRIEDKMGMKAGAASELVFKDCFVPEQNILYSYDDFSESYAEELVMAVLGITRITVGAVGTGIARGAFEHALSFAKNHKWKGKTIIHQQWAQERLTNMLMNVYTARNAYLEASYVLYTTLMPGHMPGFMNTDIVRKMYNNSIAKRLRYTKMARKAMLKTIKSMPENEKQRLQFYSSMAKVVGTDIGMQNCHSAMEMMGEYGLRHDVGMEKLFRDAKLCQIFEGTNQLNRLNMFKYFIGRNIPDVKVFG
ncbi:MAG: acyl-CoA/acyl-ACP dehydrogenase [Proteobacteria bacterium]|nr:acyl-CoA/acyl-ACP dehydrogenase [Pseudomonadota bacterium]